MSEPYRPSDPLTAVADLTKAEVATRESYAPQQIREDRPLRFFVSYSHLDSTLKEDLISRLLIRLKSHRTLRFEH